MIRQGERVLAVGTTGTGKSQALADVFARHTGQRILIDVQDHYDLGPAAIAEGVSEAGSPRQIDWRQRTIRYVPSRDTQREYNELYSAIFRRGNVLVWLDEAEGPTTSHSSPLWLRRTVKQGRKYGITHLAATQRPSGIERALVNQSEHAFVFLTSDPDDLDALSVRMGVRARDLAGVWGDAGDVDDLWQAGYVYHRLGSGRLVRMPPLPAERIKAARRHVIIPR
jgi:hypothetical protein